MNEAVVFVVDDDPAMCTALARILRGKGYFVQTYPSAEAFLESDWRTRTGCLILDVQMPGMKGTELQERMTRMGSLLPVILLTAEGTIRMGVEAVKRGSFDFLVKPAEGADLDRIVRSALEASEKAHQQAARLIRIEKRYLELTPREKEVFREVIQGKPNKQIAEKLGTTEQTVKVHRMRVNSKMAARSVVELYQFAQILGLVDEP